MTFTTTKLPHQHQELILKARRRLDDFYRLQKAGLICADGDFFPSVHYPPITMYPEISEEKLFQGYTLPTDGLLDIYAHIPFCKTRCYFCHYPVQLGERSSEKDVYLDAMEKEMDIYMRRLGIDRLSARSILVGGGTPTYLALDQLERFLQFFTKRIDFTHCKQFNYDVDPLTLLGTEGRERLKIMRDYGVDRLTIGIQSLNDEILNIMNRHHNTEEAIAGIKNAQEFGYQVNIEFIFGYPGQTLENWIDVMEKAVALETEEIQLYRLKIEAYGDYQGPIKNLLDKGKQAIPSVEDTITMKQVAIDILNQHGYHENLRRVFTKETKHYSHYAHNQCCMLYDQMGLGLTAFSSLRDRFILNTQSFEEYYQKISQGQLPLNRGLVRNQEEQIRWSIILPLKNRTVRKSQFLRMTGVPLESVFQEKIANLKAFDLIFENDKEIGLTPLGAFFADEVAQQFHAREHIPFAENAYAAGLLSPYQNCNVNR